MPYIKEEVRDNLSDGHPMKAPGELNYAITCVALEYLKDHGLSYSTINDIMGAFSAAQAEFYRRIAVNYENAKCRENGDVYPEGSSLEGGSS